MTGPLPDVAGETGGRPEALVATARSARHGDYTSRPVSLDHASRMARLPSSGVRHSAGASS